jgi:hypothetical protein
MKIRIKKKKLAPTGNGQASPYSAAVGLDSSGLGAVLNKVDFKAQEPFDVCPQNISLISA